MAIKAILFDLDDTLFQTNAFIDGYIDPIIHRISKDYKRPYDEVRTSFSLAISQSHDEFKVNPNKLWARAFEIFSKQIHITSKERKKYTEKLLMMYQNSPKLQENANKLLKALTAKGITLGVVTHASPEWTQIKLSQTKIKKYFKFVEAVNVDEFKSSIHWQKAVKRLKIDIDEIAAIGDNVKGDIHACHEIGIEKLFWYNGKNAWSKYASGELPKGTITIHDLLEMLSYV